jgi:hypothetical protein
MALSRSPLLVVAFGLFRNPWACLAVSQFPRRTPLEATPFTRVMPLASSGASSPVIGSLYRQLPHRRNPHVDRDRTQPSRFQGDAPGSHGRLGEARRGS